MDVTYVVLGALLVGAIALARELLVDRQQWTREEGRLERLNKREDAAYDRVTRAARRLVADELDTAYKHLAILLRRGIWPVPKDVERTNFLSMSEWERNKDRVAEAIDDENTWLLASAFYYSLSRLRARALSAGQGSPLTDKDRESLQSMHDMAIVLKQVLDENAPLPEDWEAQLAAAREAGQLPSHET